MKMLKHTLKINLCLLLTLNLTAQTEGIFTDPRDGTSYKTVTYETAQSSEAHSVTWMAENLNFYTENSFCLDNDKENCDTYGRLYTWFEAKEVCPPDWHLPSDEEWTQLANLFGGMDEAGNNLKADGRNQSAFNGLLGGTRDPYDDAYHKAGTAGFFWSSTESKSKEEEASDWSFASWLDELRHWEGGKLIGNSCRCVKDSNE